MLHQKTTPVPNVLFDAYLKYLNCVEIKLLLIIIRKTLGWKDIKALHGRKEQDWISNCQLRELTGCSRRALSSATEELINKNLIEVLEAKGSLLKHPQRRQGKKRMYYRLSPDFASSVDKVGNTGVQPEHSENTCAISAQELKKSQRELAQKMRITKRQN